MNQITISVDDYERLLSDRAKLQDLVEYDKIYYERIKTVTVTDEVRSVMFKKSRFLNMTLYVFGDIDTLRIY